jgi:hypothetical protein
MLIVLHRIAYPPMLLCATLLSLIGTSARFATHARMADSAGNHLPPITNFFSSFGRRSNSDHRRYAPLHGPETSSLYILSNPYTLSPVLFAAALLATKFLLPALVLCRSHTIEQTADVSLGTTN